jgi:hypothetical protein
MTKPICILCGDLLDNGKKTNREHYVPQVLIRNFRKLRIPKEYTHALRIDMRENDGEVLLAPLSAHKEWATVRVHEQCNLDASAMCRDLKYIIDHLDNCPEDKTERIMEYYAHIWGLEYPDLMFTVLDDHLVDQFFQEDLEGKGATLVYDPGYWWIGKLMLQAPEDRVSIFQEYEKHTIFLGTEKGLVGVIDEIRSK